ncbi:hypothetical protein PR048_001098 [Dryococelus australis]|uniref:Uncharacterized protein n=1 Tax=Dryococelus australis TaxID=614101 RepID=A0ABQ9IGF9_9NEOP|nr:hypothetical protein PR048_001098 [Dryococelus australis]
MNPTKRHRGRRNETTSRRTFSCKYLLKKGTEKIKVCKRMFLNTPSIGEWTALNRQKDPENEEETQENDERNLYKFHKDDWCTNRGVEPLSSCTFSQVCEEQNLSLHRPKKYECDLCAAFNNISISRKKERQERKRIVIKLVSEECLYTMDLHLYNKTKLAVHNFTIFDLKSHDGYSFLWNETEGGLTANEFSTIITSFMRSQLPLLDQANILILYSDGCCYQNRNTTLLNPLLHGHTQMEADSMQTAIERQLNHKTINVPADYVYACRRARKNSRPYVVKYVNHEYFKQFDQHHMYTTNRPGRKAGEPTVTDWRALRWNIFYKLRFSENWTILPDRMKRNQSAMAFEKFPRLHKVRLKVKKLKFEHLQSLKETMEADFHSFYNNIPFEK